jgi:hypothetical protein
MGSWKIKSPIHWDPKFQLIDGFTFRQAKMMIDFADYVLTAPLTQTKSSGPGVDHVIPTDGFLSILGKHDGLINLNKLISDHDGDSALAFALAPHFCKVDLFGSKPDMEYVLPYLERMAYLQPSDRNFH